MSHPMGPPESRNPIISQYKGAELSYPTWTEQETNHLRDQLEKNRPKNKGEVSLFAESPQKAYADCVDAYNTTYPDNEGHMTTARVSKKIGNLASKYGVKRKDIISHGLQHFEQLKTRDTTAAAAAAAAASVSERPNEKIICTLVPSKCKEELDSQDAFRTHMRQVHPTQDAEISQCSQCTEQFYAAGDHAIIYANHEAEAENTCSLPGCGRHFKNPLGLRTHKARTHSQKKGGEEAPRSGDCETSETPSNRPGKHPMVEVEAKEEIFKPFRELGVAHLRQYSRELLEEEEPTRSFSRSFKRRRIHSLPSTQATTDGEILAILKGKAAGPSDLTDTDSSEESDTGSWYSPDVKQVWSRGLQLVLHNHHGRQTKQAAQVSQTGPLIPLVDPDTKKLGRRHRDDETTEPDARAQKEKDTRILEGFPASDEHPILSVPGNAGCTDAAETPQPEELRSVNSDEECLSKIAISLKIAELNHGIKEAVDVMFDVSPEPYIDNQHVATLPVLELSKVIFGPSREEQLQARFDALQSLRRPKLFLRAYAAASLAHWIFFAKGSTDSEIETKSKKLLNRLCNVLGRVAIQTPRDFTEDTKVYERYRGLFQDVLLKALQLRQKFAAQSSVEYWPLFPLCGEEYDENTMVIHGQTLTAGSNIVALCVCPGMEAMAASTPREDCDDIVQVYKRAEVILYG